MHTQRTLYWLCFAFRTQIFHTIVSSCSFYDLISFHFLVLYLCLKAHTFPFPSSFPLSLCLFFSTLILRNPRFQFNWDHSKSKLLLCKIRISASFLQSDGSRCCLKLSRTNGFLVLSCPCSVLTAGDIIASSFLAVIRCPAPL